LLLFNRSWPTAFGGLESCGRELLTKPRFILKLNSDANPGFMARERFERFNLQVF
jgi:hypothetical protein